MNDIVGKALLGLCSSVDTPISLGVWLRYKHAQSELANISIDPRAYNGAEDFFKDYACVNLLRKYEGLDTGIDTREVALLAFDKAEEQCRIMNDTLRSYATTGQIAQVAPDILLRVQQHIAKVWGDPSFDEVFHHCSWGPGATATLSGPHATTEDKMSELPMSITPSALPYLRQVQKNDLTWCGHLLRCQVDGPVCLMPSFYNQIDYSRLLTVPKDAKTDRTIAAEPTGNIFLQLGVGNYLKARLRRYGIDLSDQTKNQHLASIANVIGLATLDLSQASDTISIGLCRVLLPPSMFKVLDDLRAPAYKLNGTVTRFHKLSSMGNGFTFQLETLIFWAVAKAVQEVRDIKAPIGVYGDDIITSQLIAQDVISVLESFGFKINVKKSYVDGRFFESCGKHYFDNVDVTPFYQKHIVDNDLEICRFINRVFGLSYDRPYLGVEKCFGKVHSRLFSQLPERLKKFQAPRWVEGDGFFRVLHFHGRLSLSRGYRIVYMSATKAKERVADGGLYAYAMRKHSASVGVPLLYSGFQPDILAREISGVTLPDFASEGKVTIRPRGRVVTYRRSIRWVTLQ